MQFIELNEWGEYVLEGVSFRFAIWPIRSRSVDRICSTCTTLMRVMLRIMRCRMRGLMEKVGSTLACENGRRGRLSLRGRVDSCY